MPDYRTPGVYVEEQYATGPIAGIGTSTAAFIGVAGRGPVGEPLKVTNLTRFTELFVSAGPLAAPYANLVRGVRGFFENGGTVAYVTRVKTAAVHATMTMRGGTPEKPVLEVTAKDAGEVGNKITVAVTEADEAGRFDMAVAGPGEKKPGEKETRTFTGLSMNARDPGFVGTTLQDTSVDVRVLEGAEGTPPAQVDPPVSLAGGADDKVSDIGKPTDWDAALAALVKTDDVALVCAPGVSAAGLQAKLVTHCENTKDRFAILDSAEGADLKAVGDQRGGLESQRGYAALYYPWLRVADPERPGETLLVPPSGHVTGVFARVDAERGVHKAPANELITGALGLERVLDDAEHADLNVAGINVLRVFAGRSRPVVWGVRTTAAPDNTAWRYVNVRRLFLFVEESIQEGIRWAVFEPNDLSLWKRLHRTVTEFLTRVWSSGALFGATAAEAFYVKIDEENNPPAVRELGQVVIEIGIAPVRPAEFVVVRIGMWVGGSQVQEG